MTRQPNFSTRRLMLLGGMATLAAGGVYWWRATPPHYGGAKLTVVQAHEAAANGDVVLVDIRTPREWLDTGVATGAYPIDMRRDDFLTILSQVAGTDKSRPIAVICARGVRSARLSRALTEAGYSNIVDVPEGMLGSAAGPGWLKSGLPVTQIEGGSG
ncbi:rhodanese-like domain-containing protein [Tropicibacter sp. Alg240-R139]|uniref:rhodanese-like domain-containing protein n=1 Tax=Tropicibacter sp. Alg240-R139 TaxID=2305991 RepID=UPI0013E002EB|nr:rhodanese-like domain-containing protein [Tropicibacter sp. Alg240-R139]